MYKYDILYYVEAPAGVTPAEMVERMNKNNINASLLYVYNNVAFIIVSFNVDFLKDAEAEVNRTNFYFYVAYDHIIKNNEWKVLNFMEASEIEQALFIINNDIPAGSYKYYSNIINNIDTPAEVVERELYLNFDFYAVGSISCNTIYLNNEMTAVLCSYEVERPTKEAIESNINFFTSAMLNIEAVINVITIEFL